MTTSVVWKNFSDLHTALINPIQHFWSELKCTSNLPNALVAKWSKIHTTKLHPRENRVPLVCEIGLESDSGGVKWIDRFVLPNRFVVFTLIRKPHIHVTFEQKPESEQVFPFYLNLSYPPTHSQFPLTYLLLPLIRLLPLSFTLCIAIVHLEKLLNKFFEFPALSSL